MSEFEGGADSVKDEFKQVIETSIHELWEPMH